MAAAVVLRLVLFPAQGLRGDIDQFVGWVHHIATVGLGSLYGETDAGPVTFGPVMAYIWALLAAVEPAFRVVTDASDTWVRMLMKVPGTLADFGLAAVVAFALRERPRVAWLAAGAVLLHPAVLYVSSWWGQYESIYALAGVTAAALAVRGHNAWAAGALAVAVLTKPQAVPLLVPFAAWFWATDGWRGLVRAGVVGAVVALLAWLPFLAAGGPLNYLRNVATYQGDVYNVLSLRAWNVWWLLQEARAGGSFVYDGSVLIGPITYRVVALVVTALLQVVVVAAVLRDARPRTLYLALAASSLIAFSFLTTMHERYGYAAVVFLALLIDDRRVRLFAALYAIVFSLNLIAAVPPSPAVGNLLPIGGPLGIVGSLATLGVTGAVLRTLVARSPDRAAVPAAPAP